MEAWVLSKVKEKVGKDAWSIIERMIESEPLWPGWFWATREWGARRVVFYGPGGFEYREIWFATQAHDLLCTGAHETRLSGHQFFCAMCSRAYPKGTSWEDKHRYCRECMKGYRRTKLRGGAPGNRPKN